MKSTTSVLVIITAIATLLAACKDAPHEVGGMTSAHLFSDFDVRRLANAACEGQAENVAAYVALGVDPNATGLDGINPLIWALTCESLPGMRALLEAGADPNQRMQTPDGASALLYSITYYDPAYLQLLLEFGGDPSQVYVHGTGYTLIEAAKMGIIHGIWDHYSILLNAGAALYVPHVNDGSIVEIGDVSMDFGNSIYVYLANARQYCKILETVSLGYGLREYDINYILLGVESNRNRLSQEQLVCAEELQNLYQG